MRANANSECEGLIIFLNATNCSHFCRALSGAQSLLDLVESRLRPGALIVADNADHSPDYLARVRAPGSGYLSVPFGEDVELSMRLG